MKKYLTPADVCKRMEELFQNHVSQTGNEPLYATCLIKFLDDGNTIEDTIKLDSCADENDENIFYYCNGIEALKSLTQRGSGEDFIVIDICSVAEHI